VPRTPPASIPPDVFAIARREYLACRRIDMGAIAAELGVARSTIFRRAGRRDDLIAAVIWHLTEEVLRRATASATELAGTDRIVAVIERFVRLVAADPALRSFLEREPEIALRILTSKHGPMQAGITSALIELIEEERRAGLVLGIDRDTLAYAIVRLGEGFLYADVVADQDPDVDRAVELMGSLLRAQALDATATHLKTVR
jgi:AcrR family transcriptional regulator